MRRSDGASSLQARIEASCRVTRSYQDRRPPWITTIPLRTQLNSAQCHVSFLRETGYKMQNSRNQTQSLSHVSLSPRLATHLLLLLPPLPCPPCYPSSSAYSCCPIPWHRWGTISSSTVFYRTPNGRPSSRNGPNSVRSISTMKVPDCRAISSRAQIDRLR